MLVIASEFTSVAIWLKNNAVFDSKIAALRYATFAMTNKGIFIARYARLRLAPTLGMTKG